jgi:hypothetical protein
MRRPLLTAAAFSALLGLGPLASAAPPLVGTSGRGAPTAPSASLIQRFGPDIRVRHGEDGRPRQLHGLSVPTTGADLGARAAAFLKAHRDVLGISCDFEPSETQSPRLRGPSGEVVRHVVRLRMRLAGLPVEGRTATVTLDDRLRVIATTLDDARLLPPANAPERLDAQASARIVEARYLVRALPANASRVLVPVGSAGDTRRAWKVPTAAIPLVAHFFVWVDAVDGAILRTAPAGPDQGLSHIPERATEEGP